MTELEFTKEDLRELERIKSLREQEELASEDNHYGFSWKGGSCKMFKGNIAKRLLEFTCTSRRSGCLTERFRLVTVNEWDELNQRLDILERKSKESSAVSVTKKEKVK